MDRLFEALVELFHRTPHPSRAFCVIGPTEEELTALAPNLLATINGTRPDAKDNALSEGPGLILPVREGEGLRAIVEQYAVWDELYYWDEWRTVIALPPGVRDDLPDGQRVLTDEMRRNLHPTLALAAMLPQQNGVLAVLPDAALSDAAGSRARAALGAGPFDPVVNLPAELRIRYAEMMAAHPGTIDYGDVGDGRVDPELAAWKRMRHRWHIEAQWNIGTRGLSPSFVWAHTSELNANVSLACLSTGGEATHLRRLTPAMVHDLHHMPNAASHLARVAHGEADRGDDDVFAPAREVARSGAWGAGEPNRDIKGYRALEFGRGDPLRRVGDLCEVKAVDDWKPGESEPGVLWFVAEGPGVLECLRRTPESPEKGEYEADEKFAARQAAWPPRLLRLTGCEDSEYLWRVLADPVIRTNIRCRAAKSYKHPSVAAWVLADTLVPWPEAAQRRITLERIAVGQKLLFAQGGVKDRLEDLAGELEGVADLHEDADAATMSPRVAEKVWDELAGGLRMLTAELGVVAPQGVAPQADDSNPQSPDDPEFPPAPIAYIRRLLDHAPESERERHAMDLLEVTLKLDCAILLALLRDADPAGVGDVWRKVNGTRPKVAPTLGKWAELQRLARKALRQHTDKDGRSSMANLRRTAAMVAHVDKPVSDAVEVRNDLAHTYGGHGPATRSALVARLITLVREVDQRMMYLRSHLLIHLESRSVRKSGVELTLLNLVNDHPAFARQTLTRARGLEWERVDEGEVYLFYAEPDRLLALWPWMTVAPDSAGRPVVWLVDGIRNDGRVTYKSPYDAGGEHAADPSEAAQVRVLLLDG